MAASEDLIYEQPMSIASSEDKDWEEVLITSDIEDFKYHKDFILAKINISQTNHKAYCKLCDEDTKAHKIKTQYAGCGSSLQIIKNKN